MNLIKEYNLNDVTVSNILFWPIFYVLKIISDLKLKKKIAFVELISIVLLISCLQPVNLGGLSNVDNVMITYFILRIVPLGLSGSLIGVCFVWILGGFRIFYSGMKEGEMDIWLLLVIILLLLAFILLPIGARLAFAVSYVVLGVIYEKKFF